MYTILVNDDNQLVVTQKERIMSRSKMVDKLHFLVNPMYKNDMDMSEFTVMLEYLLPISKKYISEILVKSDDLYKDKLEYTLPFDTRLTKEPGDIEAQLTFIKVDVDEDGRNVQYVRKTSTTKITIVPISAWSDIVPDCALNAVDMALLQVEGKIKELEEINASLEDRIPTDIVDENGTIHLTVFDEPIGNGVEILENDRDIDDGINDGVIDLDAMMPSIMI